MKETELPPPDTIIEYENGSFGPLMWHYATEGDNLKAILEEQGFEYSRVDMVDDFADDDPEGAIKEWRPPELDGWKLVGKNDSEDGPVAHYIRALSTATTPKGKE